MFSFVCERRHLWETGPSNRVKDQRRSISWAPWAWAESLLSKLTVKMERKDCAWPKIKWCFSLDLGFRYLLWNTKDCDVQQNQTFVPSNEKDSVSAQLWVVEKSSVSSVVVLLSLFFFLNPPHLMLEVGMVAIYINAKRFMQRCFWLTNGPGWWKW